MQILLSEALCLLVIDQHGVKAVTPFTEQPIVSQKWYTIVVYWSVSTHFCVDFKYSDGRHGRWIFSTLEVRNLCCLNLLYAATHCVACV